MRKVSLKEKRGKEVLPSFAQSLFLQSTPYGNEVPHALDIKKSSVFYLPQGNKKKNVVTTSTEAFTPIGSCEWRPH